MTHVDLIEKLLAYASFSTLQDAIFIETYRYDASERKYKNN